MRPSEFAESDYLSKGSAYRSVDVPTQSDQGLDAALRELTIPSPAGTASYDHTAGHEFGQRLIPLLMGENGSATLAALILDLMESRVASTSLFVVHGISAAIVEALQGAMLTQQKCGTVAA